MGAGKSISMQARNTYDKILAAVRATTAPLHMRRALVEAEPTTEGSDHDQPSCRKLASCRHRAEAMAGRGRA
jgi:hypothetical protein